MSRLTITNPTYKAPVETGDNERQPLIHRNHNNGDSGTLYECCRICITASVCSVLLTLIIVGLVYGLLVSRCHYQEYHNHVVVSIPPKELNSLEVNLLPNAELYIIQSKEHENITIDTTINAATLKDIQEISPILYQQNNYSWVYSIQRPEYFTIWLCSHSTTILRLPLDMPQVGKLLITQGYSMNIEINLPETRVNLLTIESSFADIMLQAINTTRFTSVRKSGTLQGNIKLNDSKNNAGDLETSAKKCKMYIESKNGKSHLQVQLPERNSSCEIAARSENGEIDLEMNSFSGHFEVDSQSGKITINGNAEFDEDEDKRKTGRLNGHGKNKLHAETVNGDIVIVAN